jgi:2',3'-cyclic-nucleotide 2'-phosphodiesterase (5'-nucleotidase family)
MCCKSFRSRAAVYSVAVIAVIFNLSYRQQAALAQGVETRTQITILATNDIHGGIEPSLLKDGTKEGGLAAFSGVVKAIKAGLKRKYGDRAGVLVLDAGDQFQGTLISNINEGQLVFQSMSQAGYDAAIAGNHDYDFGPKGWLDDQVTPDTIDKDPRGALKVALSYAKFPLISANTFLCNSLYDSLGSNVQVTQKGCDPILQPGQPTPTIDWSRAQSPEFLKPYLVKQVGGVRVAVIGIDNVSTPFTTTAANVSDLCFGREDEAYLRVRKELEDKADVFILLVHDGNATTQHMTDIVKKLISSFSPTRGAVVDAVISGHTHFTYNLNVLGVSVIQSGANGKAFGRVDLIYDPGSGRVDSSRTKSYAGVRTYWQRARRTQATSATSIRPRIGSCTRESGFVPIVLLRDLLRKSDDRLPPWRGGPLAERHRG